MIYYFCPDNNLPTGGIKMIYRHIDILNQNGLPASVLHQQEGFRCTWFENNTIVSYLSSLTMQLTDHLVMPEIYGPGISRLGGHIKKVIFNQNCYNTFQHYSIDPEELMTPYLQDDIIAVLVVSEDNKQYMQYTFPKLKVERIHYGINPHLFSYSEQKKKQICFMPRKCAEDAVQVINILKFRNILDDFDIVPIDGKTEQEAGAILKDSLIFMSFGYREGFGLPPAEAMACGCIVVGYHGMGGKEFFQPEFSFPIEQGDIITYARTVEEIIQTYRKETEILLKKGKMASDYIRRTYSIEREENDIIKFWMDIIRQTS